MTEQTAERWIVASAVATAGIYFYRLFTEGSAPPATLQRTLGAGRPVVPLGAFATAWGFTYLTLALIATGAPQLAGAFAILIGTADVLTNTGSIAADVGAQEKPAHTGSAARTPPDPLQPLDPLQPTDPITTFDRLPLGLPAVVRVH